MATEWHKVEQAHAARAVAHHRAHHLHLEPWRRVEAREKAAKLVHRGFDMYTAVDCGIEYARGLNTSSVIALDD